MFKKSQVTMEFVIIVSLVISISIPTLYGAFQYSSKLNEEYNERKFQAYMEEIIDMSQIIYYNGLYSKITLEPSNFNNIYLDSVYAVEINDTTSVGYYLLAEVFDNVENYTLFYYSAVPIITNGTCFIDATTDILSECVPGKTCKFCPLDSDKFLIKDLNVEAVIEDSKQKIRLSNNE